MPQNDNWSTGLIEMSRIQHLRVALENVNEQVELLESSGGKELQDAIDQRDKFDEAFTELRESFLQRAPSNLRHTRAGLLDNGRHLLMPAIRQLESSEGMRGGTPLPSQEFYDRLARVGMGPIFEH